MKLNKNIRNTVLSFACLGSLFFTGCQNNFEFENFEDYDETEEFSRVANSNLKIVAFEGGLSKLANIAANAVCDDIENPQYKALSKFATKALKGATKCLDGILDFYTLGFYKGAISALWPDETNPSPELIAIQESIDELQTSVNQISSDISNLSADLKQEFDAQKVSERIQLIESTKASFEKLFTLIELNNTENDMDYITYLTLRDYAIEAFGSVDKMRQAVQNYYTSYYSGNSVAVRSFGESYRLISEELCPWRYQSSKMMETLIAQELNFGLRIFAVSEILLNADESNNVKYDLKIQETIANYPAAKDLEKYIKLHITEGENSSEENEAIINEILDSYWKNNSSRQNQFEMKEKVAVEAWNTLVKCFNNYVNTINGIQIPEDKDGEITCNIRGVKYTFSKQLKSVNYSNELKNLAKSSYSKKTESEWLNLYKNNGEMLSAEQYKKIVDFYQKNNIRLSLNNETVPVTLFSILYIEAGIDLSEYSNSGKHFACYDSKEKMGFRITNERSDKGFCGDSIFTYGINFSVLCDGLHFWNVSVPSIVPESYDSSSKDILILRDMAASTDNKAQIERVNYYKDSFVSNETFYFLNVISKN